MKEKEMVRTGYFFKLDKPACMSTEKEMNSNKSLNIFEIYEIPVIPFRIFDNMQIEYKK